MPNKELIDVSHVSNRGSSLRIMLPKKVTSTFEVNNENDYHSNYDF